MLFCFKDRKLKYYFAGNLRSLVGSLFTLMEQLCVYNMPSLVDFNFGLKKIVVCLKQQKG